MKNNNRKKYQCKDCDGIIQSENGDKIIECKKCQGKETYNPDE